MLCKREGEMTQWFALGPGRSAPSHVQLQGLSPWRNLGPEGDISRVHLKSASSTRETWKAVSFLSLSEPFQSVFSGKRKSKLEASSMAKCVSYFTKKAR